MRLLGQVTPTVSSNLHANKVEIRVYLGLYHQIRAIFSESLEAGNRVPQNLGRKQSDPYLHISTPIGLVDNW